MPLNRFSRRRRTQQQVRADERAERLASFLGRALAAGRDQYQARQADAARVAGLSQSCWSDLERGKGATMSVRVWMRAADAVGSDLRSYLEQLPGAEQPRDAVHLRIQELVASSATRGGWHLEPERLVAGIGFADLMLSRAGHRALIEVWTWLADVGDAFRTWDRKLTALRAPSDAATPASGCWILRATRRNRALVASHRTLFDARFAGSAPAWLRAIGDPTVDAPSGTGLLWVTVRGDRLFASRR